MIEAGVRGSSGLAPGRCSRCEQGHAAGAKRAPSLLAVEHDEPERVAIEGGEPVEVAHLKPDRADMQRRAAGEGRRWPRGWGRPWELYRRSPAERRNMAGAVSSIALEQGLCDTHARRWHRVLSVRPETGGSLSVDAETVRRIAASRAHRGCGR